MGNLIRFMQTITANIDSFEKELREGTRLSEIRETELFSIFNAYFKLICSISLKNMRENARNTMKTFLMKIIELEMIFNKTNLTCSFKTKLLQFINKLSNSQVIEYIKDIIETSKEDVFSIIYDFIKHPNSSSLRERLCREDVLISKSVVKATTDESHVSLKWNQILKQVCKFCPYYMIGNSQFSIFFESFYSLRSEKITINNIILEEYKEIQMKIANFYLCVNKNDMELKWYYIKFFLDEKCYNFRHRMMPYINSILDPIDVDAYFRVLNKMVLTTLYKPDKAKWEPSNLYMIENTRFSLSKVTVCLVDKMSEDNMIHLIAFLSRISSESGKSIESEDWANILQLVFIVLFRYKLDIQERQHKEFLTPYL